ncbi:MAG: NIPSNAP family protein, partial [Gemmatimonadaceae bacterium]
ARLSVRVGVAIDVGAQRMRLRYLTWTFGALVLPVNAGGGPHVAARVVEIRSYNLKAGTRERFHQLFERDALPLLRRWNVDVVAYGASLHDSTSYFLMRSFSSVEDRQRSEDAFYGSAEWRNGPREAILAAIEGYTTVVIQLEDATVAGLRRTMTRGPD